MITKDDIVKQVGRLRGAGYTTKQTDSEMVSGWLWAIGEKCNALELSFSVKKWATGDNRFWPKPGQLLASIELSRSESPRSQLAKASDPNTPCKTCSAVIQLVQPADQRCPYFEDGKLEHAYDTPTGPARYGVLHNWKSHREAKTAMTGWWR